MFYISKHAKIHTGTYMNRAGSTAVVAIESFNKSYSTNHMDNVYFDNICTVFLLQYNFKYKIEDVTSCLIFCVQHSDVTPVERVQGVLVVCDREVYVLYIKLLNLYPFSEIFNKTIKFIFIFSL